MMLELKALLSTDVKLFMEVNLFILHISNPEATQSASKITQETHDINNKNNKNKQVLHAI